MSANLLLRPLTDIISSYKDIKAFSSAARNSKSEGVNALLGIFGGGIITLPLANKIILSMSHISIAFLNQIIITMIGTNPIYTLILSSVLSLPSAILLLASKILWFGLQNVLSALKSENIIDDYEYVVKSLLCILAIIMFKYYDILPYGLFEKKIFPSFPKEFAPSLVKFICK
ncbi:MAG: hypothetical protein Hyperionvirus6_70 [Hyperionvirus sp.]|uniref:Uncharacterized protein n=1 Tax=Hyperionvirus sp. TaxID=2487770 RepID=A0A3G5ADE6_9VIRU|nr:MAG: hypothetical protein Hyperionvirus6_70 [Hyperionvirus sp.]